MGAKACIDHLGGIADTDVAVVKCVRQKEKFVMVMSCAELMIAIVNIDTAAQRKLKAEDGIYWMISNTVIGIYRKQNIYIVFNHDRASNHPSS